MGAHPLIHTASRELEFFNHHYENGLDWYVARFDPGDAEIIGEATPGYMFWRERPHIQAARIDGLLEGVRLLAILRNPMDRARSAFLHHVRRGRIEPSADPMRWLSETDPSTDPLGIISGGWYAASLSPYSRRFGSRLRVFLHDEVVAEPGRVYTDACAHVGAPGTFLPPDLDKRSNSGEIGYTEADPRPRVLDVSAETFRQATYHHFRDDIARLEELIDRDLAGWREGVGD